MKENIVRIRCDRDGCAAKFECYASQDLSRLAIEKGWILALRDLCPACAQKREDQEDPKE